MAKKQVRLQVLTPNRTMLDTHSDYVLLRTAQGDMGVLPGHAPCAVALDFGVIQAFVNKEQTDILAVLGGFATVEDNRVTVLSHLAEPPDQIEQAMAQLEQQRAESRQEEEASDLEVYRAELALRRTLVQMDISSYSILRGAMEQEQQHEQEKG